MQDKFSYVKSIVKPTDLAKLVLGYPKKKSGSTLYYYSPLRAKERTPSLAVNDKNGITDFGTGTNYDIFSFISALFNCDVNKSCNIIAREFRIDLGEDTSKQSKEILKKITEEKIMIQNKINEWYEETYNLLANIYKEWRYLQFILPTNSKILPFVYKKQLYYESLVDMFFDADSEFKIILYKNKERFDIYERERNICK